ncbi:MAG: hypothetical protein AB7R67_18945 [Vicinamibacterales bacterium]
MSGVIGTSLSVVTPATALPIDVDYARMHVKALTNDEDTLIEGQIAAAAAYWEEQTGRAILHTVYEYALDAFPASGRIVLPVAPLVSVDALVYTDGDGNEAVFTDGGSPETALWTSTKPAGLYAARGWVEPSPGQSWPTPRIQSGAVRITFTAGYAAYAVAVPALIQAQLLMLVGAMEQFRSEVHYSEGARVDRVPMGILDLTAFKYAAQQVLRSTP